MLKPVLAAALVAFCAGPALADPLGVFGTYQLPDGDSHVRISDCGDGSPCGHVVWINPASVPEGETADTIEDAKGAKVMGLKLLHGFKRAAKDWRGGNIYDPRVGRTYQSRLKRRGDGTLEVKGCLGPICQTQIWAPTP